MRTDVKSGMIAGTVLCITGIVWFCTRQQIIKQPSIKIESQQPVPAAQRVKSPLTKPEENSAVVEIGRVHIVAQGQTLSDISKIYYNNFSGWKRIYEANKEQFPNGPNAIKPGMRLIIPQ